MENRSINVRQENQSSEVFPRRMHVPLSAQQEIHRPADEEKGIAKDSKLILKVFDKMMSVCIFMIFFGLPLFFTGMASQGVIFEKQLFHSLYYQYTIKLFHPKKTKILHELKDFLLIH